MQRKYNNYGRDQYNIENIENYVVQDRSRKRPDREITWLKAFEKEVEGRLITSLHNQILINLGKEPQPEQVHRLWDMEVKSGQTIETIPPDTKTLEIFDRPAIAGKLLILGEPGAGKTTTLLEFARALVRKAIDDPIEPMPFLLNLSSWKDPKQSIKDWAIKELTTKGIGSKLSRKWIEEQKILPLLDGLDEVRSNLQPACVTAINEFLSGEEQPRSIIICSRREEYELYPEKLQLNGAIYLQALSNEQIECYLKEVDRASLWQVLASDTALMSLVRQPLLLSITLIAYREELAPQWKELRSTQERLRFLLDAYIETMLYRWSKSRFYAEKKQPTAVQTRQRLVRLARQLQHDNETEFLIEKMQPVWLRSFYQKLLYRLVVGVIHGLVFGLIFVLLSVVMGGLIGSVLDWLFFGLIFALMFGLVGALAAALMFATIGRMFGVDRIEPVEAIKISLLVKAGREIHRQIIAGLRSGLQGGLTAGGVVGLMVMLFLGLLSGTIHRPDFAIVALFPGLALGLIYGLIGGLIRGLINTSKIEITLRTRPNQGIISSAKSVLMFMSLALLIVFLVGNFLLFRFRIPQSDNALLILGLVTCFTPLMWASFQEGGGRACIQHLSLRLVLFFNGAVPWNYARFLNHATDRMFLQRIGGRYRFIHKLLQDHFAQMSE